MSRYPECFPPNFETEILPKEAKKENKTVYRIIKSGTIDRDGFISTFEEIERELIPRNDRYDRTSPGLYSTSCHMKYADSEYILGLIMRHHPDPCIAKGITDGGCGPCQLTSERNKSKDSHVDWWIYQDSTPERYFKKEEKNEK